MSLDRTRCYRPGPEIFLVPYTNPNRRTWLSILGAGAECHRRHRSAQSLKPESDHAVRSGQSELSPIAQQGLDGVRLKSIDSERPYCARYGGSLVAPPPGPGTQAEAAAT
eukprot:766089-Hanusia_phi.AAC.1